MSFSGFVFDMIRRDKENRDMRNLRRQRKSERLKIYEGHSGMPQNTTVEDMEKIQKQTAEKERLEQRYRLRITLIILGVCIVLASVIVFIFIK